MIFFTISFKVLNKFPSNLAQSFSNENLTVRHKNYRLYLTQYVCTAVCNEIQNCDENRVLSRYC